MEGSAGSFSGTAANVVTLAEEPWVLKFVFWRRSNDLKSQVSLLLYKVKARFFYG